MAASGSAMRSAEECEISASSQGGIPSITGVIWARTTLASPQIRSERTGFFLWGIADEPFWPVPNGSPRVEISARTLTQSAIPSRSTTWVATSAAASPSLSMTAASTAGSMLEYVPTGPDSLPTAIAVGKLSGPVGTYSNIDPAVEAAVMDRLGLAAADVATQVVLRDGIADWVSVLALISTLGEPFGTGQKGSSAMPHKKNPVRSERICGLARVVRAQITPVMEGIPPWLDA